jgi:hypothetical protein
MMNHDIYRRGQVDWAIWRTMTVHRSQSDDPPPAFLTRIRRLLEIDRTDREDRPGFAFGDEIPPGKGTDRAFSAFDAFCLALAMELLDAGFKQAEVVYLLQHIRDDLRHEYREIMRHPELPRDVVPAKEHPDMPAYDDSYDEHHRRRADYRVFAVLRKLEMTELIPKLAERDLKDPVFLRSKICRGIEALALYLNENSYAWRKGMILEIGAPARMVTAFLDQAPEIKRGRR